MGLVLMLFCFIIMTVESEDKERTFIELKQMRKIDALSESSKNKGAVYKEKEIIRTYHHIIKKVLPPYPGDSENGNLESKTKTKDIEKGVSKGRKLNKNKSKYHTTSNNTNNKIERKMRHIKSFQKEKIKPHFFNEISLAKHRRLSSIFKTEKVNSKIRTSRQKSHALKTFYKYFNPRKKRAIDKIEKYSSTLAFPKSPETISNEISTPTLIARFGNCSAHNGDLNNQRYKRSTVTIDIYGSNRQLKNNSSKNFTPMNKTVSISIIKPEFNRHKGSIEVISKMKPVYGHNAIKYVPSPGSDQSTAAKSLYGQDVTKSSMAAEKQIYGYSTSKAFLKPDHGYNVIKSSFRSLDIFTSTESTANTFGMFTLMKSRINSNNGFGAPHMTSKGQNKEYKYLVPEFISISSTDTTTEEILEHHIVMNPVKIITSYVPTTNPGKTFNPIDTFRWYITTTKRNFVLPYYKTQASVQNTNNIVMQSSVLPVSYPTGWEYAQSTKWNYAQPAIFGQKQPSKWKYNKTSKWNYPQPLKWNYSLPAKWNYDQASNSAFQFSQFRTSTEGSLEEIIELLEEQLPDESVELVTNEVRLKQEIVAIEPIRKNNVSSPNITWEDLRVREKKLRVSTILLWLMSMFCLLIIACMAFLIHISNVKDSIYQVYDMRQAASKSNGGNLYQFFHKNRDVPVILASEENVMNNHLIEDFKQLTGRIQQALNESRFYQANELLNVYSGEQYKKVTTPRKHM